MKLASLKSGRDGRLVIVSDDLAWCADAAHIAPTLQAALDGWDWIEPALRNLGTDLAHGTIPRERFHERAAASPLPRAYLSLQAVAKGPLTQSRSDYLFAPRDPVGLRDGITDCMMSPGVTIVTGDVPQGVSADEADRLIRLVGLTDGLWLSGEAACSFSPVFVTPDALGAQWSGRLIGALCVAIDEEPLVRTNAESASFADLVAQAAQTRALIAGTMISIVRPSTALQTGSTLRIWMDDEKRHSIFGAIEREVR